MPLPSDTVTQVGTQHKVSNTVKIAEEFDHIAGRPLDFTLPLQLEGALTHSIRTAPVQYKMCSGFGLVEGRGITHVTGGNTHLRTNKVWNTAVAIAPADLRRAEGFTGALRGRILTPF